MCLKWEALLWEGERPRALGSMACGACEQSGGGARRLMLSWAAWRHASCAREGWQRGFGCVTGRASKRFGQWSGARTSVEAESNR